MAMKRFSKKTRRRIPGSASANNPLRIALGFLAALVFVSITVATLHQHPSNTASGPIDCHTCTWTKTAGSGLLSTVPAILPLPYVVVSSFAIASPDSNRINPFRAIRAPPSLSI